MKEKSGLSDSHETKYEEIRDEIIQGENMSKSQNIESTRQINTLEADRLMLTRKLRQNEAQIGESGKGFLGLLADHMIKVTEFTSCLRGDYI